MSIFIIVVKIVKDTAMVMNTVFSRTFSMSRVLIVLANFNVSLTGYIPSVENIVMVWPHFVSKICPGGAPPFEEFLKMEIAAQHETLKDPLVGLYKAAKDVWRERGPIARSLCLLSAFDYACWKDLPEGIPHLRMEVYHKHSAGILETSQ